MLNRAEASARISLARAKLTASLAHGDRLAHTWCRTRCGALYRFSRSGGLKRALGEDFVGVVAAVKDAELDAYQRVISSWEREHLLLNV